jgi:hypothetical protein
MNEEIALRWCAESVLEGNRQRDWCMGTWLIWQNFLVSVYSAFKLHGQSKTLVTFCIVRFVRF